MCNSKICTPFNVCMKDKKYSRKINYLPYVVDKCFKWVTNVSSLLKKWVVMVILLASEDEKIGDHWPLTTPYFEQVL